jgi:diaminohydroxyphosphoribosylaminopyrimidine deaminase / 5-amino-6-(5-phosphoribosylamino)uracil reductase
MKDRDWLAEAIALSRLCPPSTTAYAVGAVVVDPEGGELARGYSRETDPYDHAEESALAKLSGSLVDLTGATLYSSLEPCTARRSRTRTCTELIIAAGLRRVVFALREPPVLAECHGVELLEAAGVEVVEIDDLGDLVRAVNRELIERKGS